MPTSEDRQISTHILVDAGVFIGALLKGDPRHTEARRLVEQARAGNRGRMHHTKHLE